jgi:hypothetical protein
MSPLVRLVWKFSVFFALAMRLLALLPTPPLLRFFSAAPLSEVCRPEGLPFPLRFSRLGVCSATLGAASGIEVALEPEDGFSFSDLGAEFAEDAVSDLAVEELEPPPNILFSRPP